jgi:TusA-related sulfurtransferase
MSADEASIRELDLSGLKCPLPVLQTRKALARTRHGHRLRVICTDPLTVIDIPHLLQQTGDVLEEFGEADGKLTFVVCRHGQAIT